MCIVVNGEERRVPDRASIADLLSELDLAGAACAVEVNLKLVPKTQHATRPLEEGDRVEIVTLVGGG